MTNEGRLRFDQGWDAAIADVKERVEEYIVAKREGQRVAPWEQWLPLFLDVLAENDEHQATGEK